MALPGVARWRDRLPALRRFDQGMTTAPPGHAKRRRLARLARQRGHEVVIGAGTYLGDTAAFLSRKGLTVQTVEFDEELYLRASRRFADEKVVEVICGDAIDPAAGAYSSRRIDVSRKLRPRILDRPWSRSASG